MCILSHALILYHPFLPIALELSSGGLALLFLDSAGFGKEFSERPGDDTDSGSQQSHMFSPFQDVLTVVVEDLRLCTVKPCEDIERRFCFEVVSPTK